MLADDAGCHLIVIFEAVGRRVAQADMLVAAAALTEGLVLATRNVADFERCGLAVFNPFE